MLTVQDLIDIELLKLQAVAGLAGTGRLITWAHTVDLPDPWRWVSPGDLVMTTGLGLPADEEAQVSWLEQLVQSTPAHWWSRPARTLRRCRQKCCRPPTA